MFATAKQIHAGGDELQDRVDHFWFGEHLVLVVADGAGGQSGGAEAAEFFIRAVRNWISEAILSSDGFCQLIRSIDAKMSESGKLGETTCVLAAISTSGIFGASVGDSGALYISPHGIDNLTQCQNRKPFVGSGTAVPVGFIRELLNGTLLLATDGLLKYAAVECIAAVFGGEDLEAAARNLVELTRYPSGRLPDDVSVLLARAL